MSRGEVYLCTFKAPDKPRPVVILTRNEFIPRLNSVTVAPITTTVRWIPSQVILNQEDGVSEICAVNLHNVQTVPKQRIQSGGPITVLPSEKMAAVARALRFALDLG